MSTRFYDTDLTDAAWAFVAPVLPAARPGGRPRTTNLRAVLNAIFYLLRMIWVKFQQRYQKRHGGLPKPLFTKGLCLRGIPQLSAPFKQPILGA